MSEHPNPPAFPSEQGHCPDGTWNQTYCDGMSLRDWFAGQALPRTLSAEYFDNETGNRLDGLAHEIAAVESAYRIADACLSERNRRDVG